VSAWAVLVAAGTGTRFGEPKHAADLHGRPMWEWSRDALIAGGASNVVVVGDVPGGVPGGARRRDSVARGLVLVPGDVEHVLVHDAARPLLTAELVSRVLAALGAGADAVVPAIPVPDTVKRVHGSIVLDTVDRSDLVLIQTPQGFRTEVLRMAHAASDDDATDDASLVEAMGGSVHTVAGDPMNLKVTYRRDLELVRSLMETGR
jgi:2-C-methyl-D-erythritol 4-phosphate cytidylyltransferase